MPGYGAWILWSEKIAPPSEPPLPAASRSPANIQQADLRYQPRENIRYIYSFTRKLSFRGLKIPDVNFSGELYIDVRRSDAKGFTAEWSETVKEFPNSPVRLLTHLDPSARKLDLRVSTLKTDGDRQHANILKDLLALWAFPLEQDTVGNYRASFELKDGERKKIKLNYNDPGAPKIFASEHWLLWDENLSLPKEIRGNDRTHHENGPMPLTTEAVYTIQYKGQGKIPALADREWSGNEGLALTQLQQGIDPAEFGVTWENTKTELLGLSKLTSSERLRVFGDLVKLLRAGKISPAELRGLLSKENIRLGADSPLFQSIVGALATAGGKEAFAMLRAIYNDPDSPISGKGSVEAALTTTEAPIDAPTRDFLAERMRAEQNRDLALGAAFALGASLQNSANDSSTQSAIADIHEAWKAAKGNLAQQIALLDVMGNSGRSEFMPEIRSALEADQEINLQAKAIFSLRYFSTTEAMILLTPKLINPNPVLREAAVEAVRQGTWRENYRSGLETCVNSDPVEKLRASCRAALVQASGSLAGTN